MSSKATEYISVLKFKTTVRYKSDTSKETARNNEILLKVSIFDSCPDFNSFVHAIEKRLGRTNGIDKARVVLPMCMVLLCSNSYSVSSRTFHDVPDSTIEYCWECLQFVSIGVEQELQKWMLTHIANRSCIDYSTLHCRSIVEPTQIQTLPAGIISNRIRFSSVSVSEADLHSVLWHSDDVTMETMLAHVKVVTKRCSIQRPMN